jgi:cytidylate kinase
MAARIYVLGGGGSGKTTLGRLLGERLGIPVVHLDDACSWPGWNAALEAERRALREARIRELAAQESWVIEGNFPGWIEEFAHCADLIIWLDVPFRVAAWRILKRHVLADLQGNNRHPGYRNLWRFLRRQRSYYHLGTAEYLRRMEANPDRWSGTHYCRAGIAMQMARYKDRVLRLTGGSAEAAARAAEARLALLQAAAGAKPGTHTGSPSLAE